MAEITVGRNCHDLIALDRCVYVNCPDDLAVFKVNAVTAIPRIERTLTAGVGLMGSPSTAPACG
jgi:hypothetical protein